MSSDHISDKLLPERLVLFDGVCNLCNASVQFVIRHDPDGRFRFAALQSDVGQEVQQRYGLSGTTFDSFIYLRAGLLYQRSTAALHLMRDLGGAWALLYGFIIVPRPLRDAVYDLVARYRYRWFGRRESCMVPTAELRGRFL
ncbi:MAG: thiol-disulfide oxidoreductase DCC family protein [Bacteroidetes bacterium]|nr:thiol-disulfide oxidoreductase DCC family protein [Bacteroidota bacterium]